MWGQNNGNYLIWRTKEINTSLNKSNEQSPDGRRGNTRGPSACPKTHGERKEGAECKQVSEKVIVKLFLNRKGIKSKKVPEFPAG